MVKILPIYLISSHECAVLACKVEKSGAELVLDLSKGCGLGSGNQIVSEIFLIPSNSTGKELRSLQGS